MNFPILKHPAIRSDKLRQSAKGMPCMIEIPGVCSYDPEKTVLCHINSPSKGMGRKSHDFFSVYGCHECHCWLDENHASKEERLSITLKALHNTWQSMVESGLIKIEGAK